jgi:hypothetical protein
MRFFNLFLQFLAITVYALLMGCSQDVQNAKRPAESSAISHALAKSPSFIKIRERNRTATFVVDAETDMDWTVGIGEEMDTHFTREKTLKIDKRGGRIWRLEIDPVREDRWTSEYEPR